MKSSGQTAPSSSDLSRASLQVVRNPGVPLVDGGFISLNRGLSVASYLNPWLTTRESNI